MKSGLKWIVLVVVTLVSTSAWAAIWNPDTDANLLFNANFQTYDNALHTTTDAKGSLVGTLVDYNTIAPNVFGETSAPGLGLDGNFAEIHDMAPGKGVPEGNDVKLTFAGSTTVWDLGLSTDKHTWAFWFNVPTFEGSIIRHASINLDQEDYKNEMWEIRITAAGVLQFYHKNNTLQMQTASSLSQLGLTTNTWHHAAVVIDRTNSVETSTPTTQLSTKIYIDGLEVPVIVTYLDVGTMNVNIWYDSPIWFGAGDREFDGLLDDVRLYKSALTPLQISVLNQPDATKPRALSPIPRSSNVVISTNVTWEPATGATTQTLYFGTDPCNLPSITSGGSGLNQASNAQLGGPFSLNTVYYWYVNSNGSDGPLWSFNTETGKALYPSPIDGAEEVDTNGVNLSWFTPSAATYAVYFSQDIALVESNDISVRFANGISDQNVFIGPNDANSRSAIYYWRVNSTYPSGTVAGDIWSFRTKPYELVFNTSGLDITYASHVIPAYTCVAHTNGWSDACSTGSLASDGVAVFSFPNGFNYDRRYDIIVVPTYRATDINGVKFPTPLAIHVTGNFSFDGRVQIAGDDILISTQDITFARSGGYPGPKHNQNSSIFNDRTVTITDYWTAYNMPVGTHGRFGTLGTAKDVFVPTALAKSTFGPGQPVNPPYKGGGGGGSGGRGGESGRGYFFNVNTEGPSYGDKEVPVPFGGSAGGWGGTTTGGAAGGGGIEIYATGNVVFDSNSRINANGGSQLCSSLAYPAGGGGGGAVRIIAGGSVTNKGTINVNGGRGGDAAQANNTAGGGGGGRVAIFHTTGYSNTGAITANGGAKGLAPESTGLGQDGQNGTIFVTDGSPKKASAPTPVNGDEMVYYNPTDACTIQLKWYSGYGGTTDEVFCDTNPTPTTSRGSVSATRGQHSVTMAISSGNTYYWKVVTDGAVSSDTWSFTPVTWICMQYNLDVPHLGGPEWDSNRNCILDIEDFAFFVNAWLNPEFSTTYLVEFTDFERFASEWKDCYNRTNGGCAGY